MLVCCGPECGLCPKTGFTTSNTFRFLSGGMHCNQIRLDPPAFRWSLEDGSKTNCPTILSSRCTRWFVETHKMLLQYWNPLQETVMVATVQAFPVQWYVHVRVTEVISTKEQGRPFKHTCRQEMMTTMNILIMSLLWSCGHKHNAHLVLSAHTQWPVAIEHWFCGTTLNWNAYALCIGTYRLLWLLNTEWLNNMRDKQNCYMLFVYVIVSVCLISVFKNAVL